MCGHLGPPHLAFVLGVVSVEMGHRSLSLCARFELVRPRSVSPPRAALRTEAELKAAFLAWLLGWSKSRSHHVELSHGRGSLFPTMDSRVTGAVECLNWLSQPEAIGLVSSGHHPDLAQAIRRLCDVYSDRVQQGAPSATFRDLDASSAFNAVLCARRMYGFRLASLIAKPKSLGNDAGPASTSTPPSLEVSANNLSPLRPVPCPLRT